MEQIINIPDAYVIKCSDGSLCRDILSGVSYCISPTYPSQEIDLYYTKADHDMDFCENYIDQ